MRLNSENLITSWQMDEHLESTKAKSGQENLLKLWREKIINELPNLLPHRPHLVFLISLI